MKIKAERMAELEKFGFIREDSAYRHKIGLMVLDWEDEKLPRDRKLVIEGSAYKSYVIENMLEICKDLITAGMVEE